MLATLVESAGSVVLAVLGISFLIFMHELGHFLVARLFGVRVEVFSIGFGPRLFGGRRGDTDYRISAVPLGGYVKMAGEYSEQSDDRQPEPDELSAKPIWQRFMIFAAGPVANLVLAFVLFPIAFGNGVPFLAPLVGDVVPGGPAWKAGLQPGDEFVSINGNHVYGLSDVSLEVALSDPNDTRAVIRRAGHEFEQRFELERSADDSRYDIGVLPAVEDALHVEDTGPAYQAGLRTGDRLLAVGELAIGAWHDGKTLTAQDVLGLGIADGAGIEVRVEREGRTVSFPVAPELHTPADATPQLGALALQTRTCGLRGKAAVPEAALQLGDVILQVGDRPVFSGSDIRTALAGAATPVTLLVRRDGNLRHVPLDADMMAAVIQRDVVFDADLQGPPIVRMHPAGALREAGVPDGALLLSLNDMPLESFAALHTFVNEHREQVDYDVRYAVEGVEHTVSVRARPTPVPDYGLWLELRQVVYDVSLAGAIGAGVDASVNALRNTGMTLAKLFTGEVGTENLGGPLAISKITYESAQWDFAKLLFFLALLSVNLGFINLLPVPVLDGGQMVFLLCEKVKGSRLSERFLQNAQMAGFVAILALMVYVTFNDILRFT